MIKYLGVVLEGEKTLCISLCGKGHTVNGKVLSKRKHATKVGTKKRGQSHRELKSSRGKAVFRIRDILVKIQIRGSVLRLTDPDPNSALFVGDLQASTCQFFFSVFLLIRYCLKVHLHQIKSKKEVTNQ
jgi:hypothetical protein